MREPDIKPLAQVNIVDIDGKIYIQTRIFDTIAYKDACHVMYHLLLEAKDHCVPVQPDIKLKKV